jgi:hypothetical protein
MSAPVVSMLVMVLPMPFSAWTFAPVWRASAR